MKDRKTKEAQSELEDAIETVFYVASLLRSAGLIANANRVGDIGDKLHDEWMALSALGQKAFLS